MMGQAMFDDLIKRLTSKPELLHEYAALRSSLNLGSSSGGCKSVLVTSAQPLDGKTTIVLDLALTAMLSGRKVIIVDADMRRPRIHEALELPNTLGLSDILGARTHAREVVQTVKAMGGNPLDDRSVSVITAGLGGAALTETLGGPILKDAIGELTRAYDAVLVDSPPVLAADDALLLAPLVDGVIVVVHTGIVTESDLKLTKARLEGVGGRVLGVVMNRFDPRVHGPGAHPYAARYYERG